MKDFVAASIKYCYELFIDNRS